MPMPVTGTNVEITVNERTTTCSCGRTGKVRFSELGVIPPNGWVVTMHQRPAQLGGRTQLVVACQWACAATNLMGATKQDQDELEKLVSGVNVQVGGKIQLG